MQFLCSKLNAILLLMGLLRSSILLRLKLLIWLLVVLYWPPSVMGLPRPTYITSTEDKGQY